MKSQQWPQSKLPYDLKYSCDGVDLMFQTITFGTITLEFKKLITQYEHTACRIARLDEVVITKKKLESMFKKI